MRPSESSFSDYWTPIQLVHKQTKRRSRDWPPNMAAAETANVMVDYRVFRGQDGIER
jgi:hypothetical protein